MVVATAATLLLALLAVAMLISMAVAATMFLVVCMVALALVLSSVGAPTFLLPHLVAEILASWVELAGAAFLLD